MDFQVNSVKQLEALAPQMLAAFKEEKCILLYGEMGVGKTTLIKILCQLLGVDESTNSPTFSIVNEYRSREQESIYHFDFYRIEDETEVFDLGYEEYFYSGNYCFVEWPEKIPNLLPEHSVKINIVLDEMNNRVISVVL